MLRHIQYHNLQPVHIFYSHYVRIHDRVALFMFFFLSISFDLNIKAQLP